MFALFFYGTLLFAEVRRAVVGRELSTEPALLRGFERRGVLGRPYPALVLLPGGSVAGALARDVSEKELLALDAYEDDFYERIVVDVEVGGELAAAHVYVVPLRSSQLLATTDWSPEQFERQGLADFLRRLGPVGRR